jgi:hypothetical protein
MPVTAGKPNLDTVAGMAEEALNLLSTSASRWRTVRVSGHEWRSTALVSQAWKARLERQRAEGQNFSVISFGSPEARPDETDEEWSLQIAGPWRRAKYGAGRETIDVVFHGSTWWSNSHGFSRTNGGSLNSGHGEGAGEFLVQTADYPFLIEVEEVNTGSRLGRDALDARVTVRHGLPHRRGRGLHGLVIGDADEVLLSIDRECGVILHAASWFRGSVCRVLEMNDVTFDEPFHPKAFEITPLAGLDWVDLGRDGRAGEPPPTAGSGRPDF